MRLTTTITKDRGWWRIAIYETRPDVAILRRETFHGGTLTEARQTARRQEAELRREQGGMA
jgi:hypothetical protein